MLFSNDNSLVKDTYCNLTPILCPRFLFILVPHYVPLLYITLFVLLFISYASAMSFIDETQICTVAREYF